MRAHFEELLASGDLEESVLVDILTELEGWGNQQIYLFNCTTKERILKQTWLKKTWVRDHLRDVGPGLILDAKNPTALPESPKLIGAYFSEVCEVPAIRFVWAQKLISKKHDPSLDYKHEGFSFNSASILERVLFQGYREKIYRGIISFDWEIGSGSAMLLIHKLSEREYKPMQKQIMRDLNDLFYNVDFKQLSIRPAMQNLDCLKTFDDSIKVTIPRQMFATPDRNTFTLQNRHQQNVSEDSSLASILENYRTDSDDFRFGIRWKPDGIDEFRVQLNAEVDDDQRIAIDAQRSEKVIRDVVRGIRCCL